MLFRYRGSGSGRSTGSSTTAVTFAFLAMSLAICKRLFVGAFTCDENLCASIVSKCLITSACKCDSQNQTCALQCYKCLGFFYHKCCSCLDLCIPKTTITNSSQPTFVEELEVNVLNLFDILTREDEDENAHRWNLVSVSTNIRQLLQQTNSNFHLNPVIDINKEVNCTAAYLTRCMNVHSCKNNCAAMGASAYRWFHNGCCECDGKNCVELNIKHPNLCPNCDEYIPDLDNNNIDEPFVIDIYDNNEYDYGQHDEDDTELLEENEEDLEVENGRETETAVDVNDDEHGENSGPVHIDDGNNENENENESDNDNHNDASEH